MPRKTAVLFVPLVLCVLSVPSPAAAEAARTPATMEALLANGSAADEVVDRACGVRDCRDIRLFWYTDLDAAKAAARATGRPILSLRLLGRLDEEFSCANSRFFRTAYYKNREINELLRERYVLHWRSVRPVPRVTIDFGDGTKLERTLTGNSIHYVLDSHGRLIEALPGLSGPDAFRSALDEADLAARKAGNMSDVDLAPWLARRHRTALSGRAQSLLRELAVLSETPSRTSRATPRAVGRVAAVGQVVPSNEDPKTLEDLEKIPTARDPWKVLESMPGVLTDRINVGGLETGSKMATEIPLLQALDDVSDEVLRDLAGLRRPRIHLDDASRAFLLRKQGVTDPADAERLVDSFETSMALDEVINDYRMGPAILRKLSEPKEAFGRDLEAFNQWVYEDVFRQPLSDPWLGLAPEDVYVALPASTRAARPE